MLFLQLCVKKLNLARPSYLKTKNDITTFKNHVHEIVQHFYNRQNGDQQQNQENLENNNDASNSVDFFLRTTEMTQCIFFHHYIERNYIFASVEISEKY
jgi:hypothetical protein